MDQQITDEQLWALAEGQAPADTQASLHAAIAADAILRQRYEALLGLEQSLRSMELEAPSMRFTKNVLDQLAEPAYRPALTYINKWMIRGIAALFVALFAAVMAGAVLHPSAGGNAQQGYTAKLGSLIGGHALPYLVMINILTLLVLADAWYRKKRTIRLQGL